MLKGKSAIVTGSTSVTGLVSPIASLPRVATCCLTALPTRPRWTPSSRNSPTPTAQVDYSPADMSSARRHPRHGRDVRKKFESVDILVNNAGIQFTARVEGLEDKWDAIIAINMSVISTPPRRRCRACRNASTYHQHRLGAWPSGFHQQGGLRRGQARRRRPLPRSSRSKTAPTASPATPSARLGPHPARAKADRG